MNENILDDYGDFIEAKYFLSEYNILPSQLSLDILLKESAENIKIVFDKLTVGEDFEIVFEEWKISKNFDEIETKDFVNYYFLKSTDKSLCIQLQLKNEELSVNYFYDRNQTQVLDWIQKSYKDIRNFIAIPTSPIFKVLSRDGRSGFYTEEINIESIDLNIDLNYNDDFIEIDSIINGSLELDKSGLILLHGKPGTGKTTYIRNLLTRHEDKNFIFVPNDFVRELLQPDFISFLITSKKSILVIEDAEKVISSRESNGSESVVSTILQLTDGLFSDYLNIKIICTFNTDINNVDQALLRKGRMIAFYEFKELTLNKTNRLLKSIEQPESNEELAVSDIYNYEGKRYEQMKKGKIGF